jgi:hypothetical protein
MPFDDVPLRLQILIALTAPPILTVFCWLLGRRLSASQRQGTRARNGAGFWAMLIAAYLLFALVLAGSRFFARSDRANPSTQMVQ